MRRTLLFLAFLAVALLFALATSSAPAPVAAQGESCPQLVARAFTSLGTNCANLETGTACLGFGTVETTFGEPVADDFFTAQADRADVAMLSSIHTNMLDSAAGDFGLSVLQLDAGLSAEQAANGSFVTYLMVGDVNLEADPTDFAAPWQSFTLRTGFTAPECSDAPPSALFVQTTTGAPADIVVNGVNIRVNSLVALQTDAAGNLIITTLEGMPIPYYGSPFAIGLNPGLSISIPLDVNGKVAEYGRWTNWRLADVNAFDGLTGVPNTIIPPYDPPTIIQASGIDVPPTIDDQPVVEPRTPWTALPDPTGAVGQALERDPWTALALGPNLCVDWLPYQSNEDGNWDVRVLGYNGSFNGFDINVSQNPARDSQPTVSPDGRYIAFTTDRYAIGGYELVIYEVDPAVGSVVGGPYRLTYNTGSDQNPVWGAGTLIAFESDRDGNKELYTFDVTDGTVTRLTDNAGPDVNAYWHPTENAIFYQTADNTGGNFQIVQLDLNTGAITAITEGNSNEINPVVSHDGTMIAFLRQNSTGRYDLWVKDLASGEERQLTNFGVNVRNAVFSPNDQLIAFDSNVDNDADVFGVEIESGNIELVTVNEVADVAPQFWCSVNDIVLYHTGFFGSAVDNFQAELAESNVPSIDAADGIFAPGDTTPTRLTNRPEADDIYAVGEPRTETGSGSYAPRDIFFPGLQ